MFCLNLMTTTEATSKAITTKKSMPSCEVSVPVNPVTVSQTTALDISPRHPKTNRIQAVIDAKALKIDGIYLSSFLLLFYSSIITLLVKYLLIKIIYQPTPFVPLPL